MEHDKRNDDLGRPVPRRESTLQGEPTDNKRTRAAHCACAPRDAGDAVHEHTTAALAHRVDQRHAASHRIQQRLQEHKKEKRGDSAERKRWRQQCVCAHLALLVAQAHVGEAEEPGGTLVSIGALAAALGPTGAWAAHLRRRRA